MSHSLETAAMSRHLLERDGRCARPGDFYVVASLETVHTLGGYKPKDVWLVQIQADEHGFPQFKGAGAGSRWWSAGYSPHRLYGPICLTETCPSTIARAFSRLSRLNGAGRNEVSGLARDDEQARQMAAEWEGLPPWTSSI